MTSITLLAAVAGFGHMRRLALRHKELWWSVTLNSLGVDVLGAGLL